MIHKTWSGIDPGILRKADLRQERLNRLRPWPARAAERLWNGLLPSWIAGSAGLDGNRLSIEEAQQLLEHGQFQDHYTIREHFEILNHRRAIEFVRRLAGGSKPICTAHVRRLHAILMRGIDEENAGRYRQQPIESDGDAKSVSDLLLHWEKWLHGPAGGWHPIERATTAHYRLLKIQPFLDGNGLTARLMLCFSLLRDRYMPAIISRESRHDYREALYRADNNDLVPLVTLVVNAVEHVQRIYLLTFSHT